MTVRDEQRSTLTHIARALRLESHTLAADPMITWQQVANRLQWAPGPAALLVEREADRRRQAACDVRIRLRSRYRESDALLRRLEHGSDWLSACAMTADGTTIVSACMDKTLRVWDTGSGRLVRVLRGLDSAAVACGITSDGRWVAATGGDGRLTVWLVDDALPAAQVTAHESTATGCALLPDGRAVLTFGVDGQIRGWSLPGVRPQPLRGNAGEPVRCGDVSSDGLRYACGTVGGSVLVGSTATGEQIWRLQHGAEVLGCAFGGDPALLVSAGVDGRAVLWDLGAGTGRAWPAHDSPVQYCALSADGRTMATAADDGLVRLWRLPEVKEVAILDAHAMTVVGCSLSRDASLLASAAGDGTVCVWDTASATGARRGGHVELVECCAFDPAGTTLLTAGVDGSLRRWDVATMLELGEPAGHPGRTVRMAQAAGRVVLAAGENGTVLVAPATQVGEHGALVWDLAVSRDGARAVTAGDDGICRVWDLVGRGGTVDFREDGGPVHACAITGDGEWAVSGGHAGVLHRWRLRDGDRLASGRQDAGVWCLALDGADRPVTGGVDGSVRLWPPDLAGPPRLLGRHDGTVQQVVWVDAEQVASCAADGTVAVWQLDDPAGGHRWPAHRGTAYAITASRGRRALVSGGADGVVAVWELSGRPIVHIPFPGRIHAVAAHPGRPLIACAGDGGLVHLAEILGIDA